MKNQIVTSGMSSVETKQAPPSFEDVIEDLGTMGRFQVIQIGFCYLSMLMTSFIILSFVFLGYEPPHVCNRINETRFLSNLGLRNDTTAVLSYQTCGIRTTSNMSGKITEIDVTTSCPDGHNFSGAEHTTLISDWNLVCDSNGVAELSQTLFNVGQLVGGLVASAICDRFGRKPVFIGSSFFACVLELALAAAPNIFVVCGLKLASGVFYQAVVCCFFVYGMEFVSPRHREVNGVVMCLIWVVDVILVGVVAYIFKDSEWRYFQGAVGLSGITFLIYPFILHESPRWLAANGKHDEALRILKIACKKNGKDFDKIKQTFNAYVAHAFPDSTHTALLTPDELGTTTSDDVTLGEKRTGTKQENPTFLSLLRNSSLRRTTLISGYLFATNLLTYQGLYFTSSNVSGDRFLNFTLMSVVEFPCCLCILVMMKYMTRRRVMEIFMILTALSLMASGLIVTFNDGSGMLASLSTALFILGKFSISASFNMVFIVIPELYPTNLRSTAMGFCSGVARIGGMVAPFLRPLYQIVAWGPSLIFTVMCLLAFVLTFFLPETKDENLPDTVQDMGKKRKHGK